MKQLSILCCLLFFATKIFCQDRLTGKPFATRSEVIAQNGMACTSHPLATQAAIDILKKGGSAIDAAIAANAVIGVVEPEMNGIGGDLFAIVFDAKTEALYGLNASGWAPAALTPALLARHHRDAGEWHPHGHRARRGRGMGGDASAAWAAADDRPPRAGDLLRR